jgi:hypothetical protein
MSRMLPLVEGTQGEHWSTVILLCLALTPHMPMKVQDFSCRRKCAGICVKVQ